MTAKRTDATSPTGLLRLAVLGILSLLTAAVYAGCQSNQTTTNQPPPASNVATTPPQSADTPEQPTVDRKEWDSEEKVKEYIATVIKEKADKFKEKHHRVGHDEPIIITDGSVHIKSPLLNLPDPADPSMDDFVLKGGDKKLVRKVQGHVTLVYIVTHPSTSTTRRTTYTFSGDTHSEVSVAYGDKDDFLTITTRDTGDREKTVIRSRHVPFSDSRWKRPDARHEWVYDLGTPLGHRKVFQSNDVFSGTDEFPEARGDSYVEFHVFVPTP